MESQTERITRLLVLWLDLHRAVSSSGKARSAPWECETGEVARIWEKITDPKNQQGLEEWLLESAPGEAERWAQEALLQSRRRGRSAGTSEPAVS